MEQVPSRVLAGFAGLRRRPLFEASQQERADVNVAERVRGSPAGTDGR
jgi:hypothetical protein